MNKIIDIEILRAFAVGFVVLHHADGNLYPRGHLFGAGFHEYFGGWVGVDLFFVISGFVIGRGLIPVAGAAPRPGTFRAQTGRFWARRGLRLLPSAWLWLAAILLLQLMFNDSGVFGSLRANLWATAAGVFNFANFRFADAFMNYEYGVSFVYWSLSLEEQFYLLLPLLVWCSGRYLCLILGVIILVQIQDFRGLWLLSIRSDGLAWGLLLAIFSRHQWYQRLNPGSNGLAAGGYGATALAGLVLLVLIGSRDQLQLPFQLSMVAFVAAVVVFTCSFDSKLLGRVPGSSLLVWIGARSYAIYLIHIPAFYIMRETLYRLDLPRDGDQYWLFPVALALVLVLAELNFRCLEKPAMKLSRRYFGEPPARQLERVVQPHNESR